MESWSSRNSPGDNSARGPNLTEEFVDRDRLLGAVRNVMVAMLLEQLVKEEHHEKRIEVEDRL